MRNRWNIFVPHCSGLLTDCKPHGDGLVAHGFIARLAERGHTLHIAAERVELSAPLPENVYIYQIAPRVCSATARRLDYMLQVRSLFHRLSKSIHFDIVHQLNPVYTGVSLALWGTEVPIVLGPYVADWPIDPHGISGSTSMAKFLLQGLKTFAAFLQQRNASALLLTTEEARARVIYRDRESPIHFVTHGVDGGFFSPTKQVNTPSGGSKVILFYANISERKGIFDLLRAFEIVGSAWPDAELWIAGEGEQRQAAEAFASKLRHSKRIRFLGRQTQRRAVQLFRKSTVYCLPSHGEPFGMTVAEAMSCGVPVIVTDAGGVRWLVDDEGGLRVPMKNPEALAAAISELLADPIRCEAMGQHNRQKVLSRLTWDRVIDQLEEVYGTTVSKVQMQRAQIGVAAPSSVEDFS